MERAGKRHVVRGMVMVVGAAVLTGCLGPQSMARNEWMSEDGLPHDRYRVGGGLEASFIAPVDGVAMYVEAGRQKWITSEGLKAGEKFESPGSGSPARFEEVVGVSPAEARPVLYFVPIEDMGYKTVDEAE